jgi:hypothetical protein
MIDWLGPEWVAALTSSTAIGVVGFAVGTYYKSKVERAIQHNFDSKLEILRAGFRRDEEALRADLRSKGEQIAALRSGTLSGLANRYAALDKRRLEAIDKLWTATVKQAQFKMVAKMTASIKMEIALDAAAKQDAEGAKLRDFAKVIWNASGIENVKAGESPHTERPYLPPLVWALYSAYSQVLSHPVAQIATMRAGVGSKLLADPKPLIDLVKSALPHQTEFIDKYGTAALAYLIEELEEALLREIQRTLHNPDADQASLEQAAAILKAAEKLADASTKTVDTPPTVAN